LNLTQFVGIVFGLERARCTLNIPKNTAHLLICTSIDKTLKYLYALCQSCIRVFSSLLRARRIICVTRSARCASVVVVVTLALIKVRSQSPRRTTKGTTYYCVTRSDRCVSVVVV